MPVQARGENWSVWTASHMPFFLTASILPFHPSRTTAMRATQIPGRGGQEAQKPKRANIKAASLAASRSKSRCVRDRDLVYHHLATYSNKKKTGPHAFVPDRPFLAFPLWTFTLQYPPAMPTPNLPLCDPDRIAPMCNPQISDIGEIVGRLQTITSISLIGLLFTGVLLCAAAGLCLHLGCPCCTKASAATGGESEAPSSETSSSVITAIEPASRHFVDDHK